MNEIRPYLSNSDRISASFSKSAEYYHEHAEIQKKAANGLAASLRPWKEIVPPGPVLEVGCGSGFLTGQILREFPGREFHITDLSESMLAFTRKQLGDAANRSYFLFNVDETEDLSREKYALIVSNFSAQWFSDTPMGLEKLTNMLKPGGLLLTAFPGNHSFLEWYESCLELGLPYTANPLPDVEEVVIKLSLGPVQIDYYENNLVQNFDRSMDFFRHLKKIGAATSTSGKSLAARQLKLLTDFWDKKTDNQVKVSWHVVYLAAKKDMQ